MSPTQAEKFNYWMLYHQGHQSVGVAFFPTGIGDGVIYTCGTCRKQIDDSEIHNW